MSSRKLQLSEPVYGTSGEEESQQVTELEDYFDKKTRG